MCLRLDVAIDQALRRAFGALGRVRRTDPAADPEPAGPSGPAVDLEPAVPRAKVSAGG